MVDTINPNTNQPDVPDNDRFYGGFDKPEDTKINLMESTGVGQMPPAQDAPPVQPVAPAQPVAQNPVADVAPLTPAEVKHTSYVNTADMVNWRGIMVIVAMGLAATLLAGIGIYFGFSSFNNSKLNEQQSQLETIQKELAALRETPTPLELPASATPTPAPVVAPVTTPTETPVTTPATLPANKTEGTTAAG